MKQGGREEGREGEADFTLLAFVYTVNAKGCSSDEGE